MTECLADKVTAVLLGIFSHRAGVQHEEFGRPSKINQIVSALPESICKKCGLGLIETAADGVKGSSRSGLLHGGDIIGDAICDGKWCKLLLMKRVGEWGVIDTQGPAR